MFNYSFWADEAYISGIAYQLALGKLSFIQALNAPGITYQRLHMLILSLLFKVFGASELIARIPSLFGYILGIIFIYFLAKRLSNTYGGILASFMYAFSHLNLSYSWQAKPYITIEALLLFVLYLLSNKKRVNHILVVALCCIATLLHSIGVFLWVVYLVNFIINLKEIKITKSNKKIIWTIILIIGSASMFILPMVLAHITGKPLFRFNNTYQFIKLFAYKYALISVSAFFGYIWLIKKEGAINVSIFIYGCIVAIFVSFTIYIFNIRYVLTFFGILFLYFGIFWAKVGEWYLPKKSWVIPLAVMLLVYVTGYKIVRWPQTYFNPNIDKYGDVQIANYKDFYTELKQKFPDYKNMYVANDTFDVEYWYFGRYSNTYFMKFVTKPYQHATVKQAPVYGSLDNFKKVMREHPQGLLIMEDWQSFLPDDIKMYAKKNLRLEFRVESLKEAQDDPWPLALYSWGIK
jgi:hypothetical protein